MSFHHDRERAIAAAERLKLFAQPQRLMILSLLLDHGEQSVAQIDRATHIGQPALSQQLAELRKHGEVSTRRQAKQIFYSLADKAVIPDIKSILAAFDLLQPPSPPKGLKTRHRSDNDSAANFATIINNTDLT